jgi:hypothetical protein
MKIHHRAATLTLLAATLAAPAPAADGLAGSASLNAEKATFTHGVATWHAKERELSLGFFPGPPLGEEKPHLVVELVFNEGTTKAAADAVMGCHMGFYGFKDGPFDNNGGSGTCGVAELGGELKDGGLVTGKLKGAAEFPAMGPLKAKSTAWETTFTATLRASDASVEMEAAVGPKARALPAGGGEVGKAFLAQKCMGAGPFAMKNCKVLGGREDATVAIVSVVADTMGSRMRNDFTLVKEGGAWKVEKEGAWRMAE